MLFETDGSTFGIAQKEFTQIYPRPGWVEHDPEEIWDTTIATCREMITTAGDAGREIAAVGITNQRETTVIWDRNTGKPVHNAIVWQDRRTADYCKKLRDEGHGNTVTARTGLLLDPYFSGTKVHWLLENVAGARTRAANGELAFGTIDSFLIWRLTGGKRHVTDATNACRTLLFNIHDHAWDRELLSLLEVPDALLPEVLDCTADFGTTRKEVLGASLPIAGVAGDQHAASIGQVCIEPGMIKSTYGTGCFMMLNTGNEAIASKNRLLTTIGYRIQGRTSYALEGSIFIAGAAVQWLRDGLGIIEQAGQTAELAESLESNQGVYLVPAFTGLGAPWWDTEARGAIYGLTRDSGPASLARAALESVAYQSDDLLRAMRQDGADIDTVRVDGGMINNDWLAQFLADMLDVAVDRPVQTETTALGAAWLAAVQVGLFDSLEGLADSWQRERQFTPTMDARTRAALRADWAEAVRRTRTG
ncbi:MAG: glycerol kinase [Gammaproteobacteria bacterium]|nr:MAG: glycerol kinase [Gammaproteobacteria bacterium]